MTSDAVVLTYALAPDVEVEPADDGVSLRAATSRTWVRTGTELKVLKLLEGDGSSEAQIHDRLQQGEPECSAETHCAALLFRLDRLGLLARSLNSAGRRLASCIPLRPPPIALPERPPEGLLRLSQQVLVRADAGAVSLEVPGSWARMMMHDRDLLPLLHDLTVGRQAIEIAAVAVGYSKGLILAVLAWMGWCELLDARDYKAWPTHDLLFHARIRKGYARVLLGKTPREAPVAVAPAASETTSDIRRLALEPPNLTRLLTEDPPYAWVSDQRKSLRRQGSAPLTSGQLSEFLFRTLHERGGRRPYPSGGACYPLTAYLAVHRCLGVVPGLYAYDSALHELISVGEPGTGFDRLLADAAEAANVEGPPQILLVLAARYWRTRRVYGNLSYSLILKETGAVFQVAMMAAAAMGLAACPLGCGDSLLFSRLLGVDPLIESSVGELMLGSPEEHA
jgi:oxazoline/thiazoline dehydrogenase